MKQYQRNLEKEFERLLVNEDHQEQIDYQDELEELRVAHWSGLIEVLKGDSGWVKILPASKIGYDKRIVNKVERVMKDMRKEYGDELFDDPEDFDDENLGENYEGYFPKHLEYDMDRFRYPIIESGKKENKNDWFYEEVKVQENLEKEEYDNLIKMLRRRHHLSPTKRIVF